MLRDDCNKPFNILVAVDAYPAYVQVELVQKMTGVVDAKAELIIPHNDLLGMKHIFTNIFTQSLHIPERLFSCSLSIN